MKNIENTITKFRKKSRETLEELFSLITVRDATTNDLQRLSAIDRSSYGEYGASEGYFKQKLIQPNAKILVSERLGEIVGFAILEKIDAEEIPNDYANLHPFTPPKDKWIHINSFTTISNYQNSRSDGKLIREIERVGKQEGFLTFGICLSINHPYPKAFQFWGNNGFRNSGKIQWIGSPKEPVDCYLYEKSLGRKHKQR